MKKFMELAALGAILAITCFGCVAGYDQYGRPTLYPLEVVSYPGYPADVYPYYWGGYYYYPHWNGTVWSYNVYSSPLPNWTGPPMRHSGPAPRLLGGGGGHTGNVPAGQVRQAVPMMQQQQFQPQPQYNRIAPTPTPRGGGGQYQQRRGR